MAIKSSERVRNFKTDLPKSPKGYSQNHRFAFVTIPQIGIGEHISSTGLQSDRKSDVIKNMTTASVTLKRSNQEIWQIVRRDLLSPTFFVCAMVTLAGPRLVTLLSYFFLWTIKFVPSGAVAWIAIVVFGAITLRSFAKFLNSVSRNSKALQPYRKAARAGDQEAIKAILALREDQPLPKQMFLGIICMNLLLPAMIPLVIMRGDEGGNHAVRDHGKLRRSTRQEDLQAYLDAYQKGGIFKPIGGKAD
jgi:hypothetical protein